MISHHLSLDGIVWRHFPPDKGISEKDQVWCRAGIPWDLLTEGAIHSGVMGEEQEDPTGCWTTGGGGGGGRGC